MTPEQFLFSCFVASMAANVMLIVGHYCSRREWEQWESHIDAARRHWQDACEFQRYRRQRLIDNIKAVLP